MLEAWAGLLSYFYNRLTKGIRYNIMCRLHSRRHLVRVASYGFSGGMPLNIPTAPQDNSGLLGSDDQGEFEIVGERIPFRHLSDTG